MVLFGDHAASPHGTPGERKLVKDEYVLFDLGLYIIIIVAIWHVQ